MGLFLHEAVSDQKKKCWNRAPPRDQKAKKKKEAFLAVISWNIFADAFFFLLLLQTLTLCFYKALSSERVSLYLQCLLFLSSYHEQS